MKNKFLILPILAAFLLSSVSAFANVGVQEDGTPLGSATDINFSSGLTATSDGSTVTVTGGAVGADGNFTGDGLTITADIAPTKFIFTGSSGDLSTTGLTAGTGDLTLENGQVLDGGTNGTIKLIEASDTLSFIFSGSTIQLDSSDGGFQFALSNASEGQVDFLTNGDTDDYLVVKTVSDVPTIATLGTSNLTIVPDGGTTAVTGILTVSSGLTASSTITLQNSETIVNSTNNTVEVGGGTNTILSVLDTGTSDSDASLLLRADASADNGDDWRLTSDGGTNSLFFENDTSGSQATILTLANTGLITTTGDLTVAGTTPLVTIGDGGDEDAGIQINSDTNDFYIASENSADDLVIGLGSSIGTTPILSMTDTGITEVRGSTDGDLTIYGAGTTASDAYLRLVGDAGADAADRWQFFNDSSAGSLLIQNDTSVAGTYVTKLTMDSVGIVTTTNDIIIDGTTPQLTIGSATGQGSPIIFECATADGFETTLAVADATADHTVTIPTVAANAAFMMSALTTNNVDAANSVTGVSNGLLFEGATADGFETTLAPTDVGADATITLPTKTGTLHGSGAVVALTPGATPTLTVVAGRQVFTYQPADNTDATFNASGTGSAGDVMTFIFTTDAAGSGDEVMTFGTNMISTGTLTMANLAADVYVVSFVSDGSKWVETGRTTVQTT